MRSPIPKILKEKDSGDGGTYAGAGRSGTVSDQSFYRKDGICHRPGVQFPGADVTLVTGKTALSRPLFVDTVEITTAREMYEAVTERYEQQDIVIKAAAVADYRPREVSAEKVKKSDGEMAIRLERTDDILQYLGLHKREDQFLCGFSMETENMLGNSRAKLVKKNLDMIVANNLKVPGAGFAGDTNVVTLITQDGEEELPLLSKEETAVRILNKILGEIARRK